MVSTSMTVGLVFVVFAAAAAAMTCAKLARVSVFQRIREGCRDVPDRNCRGQNCQEGLPGTEMIQKPSQNQPNLGYQRSSPHQQLRCSL